MSAARPYRLLPLLGVLVAIAAGCGDEDREPEGGDAVTLDAAPAAVRGYVEAVNGSDLDALVAAFHEDGEVIDVGREIAGPAAIRRWAEAEVIGGRLTVLGVRATDSGATLRVRFAPGGSGGFEANYEFAVDGGRIRRATLSYA